MNCKYSECKTHRPLNAYEIEMGWHVPCLNAKHKTDRSQRIDVGKTAGRSKPNKRQYSKTGERYQAVTG